MSEPQRMNPLDTWFLHVEDDADHMHIGSIGVFEGPPPTWPELRATIASKLDRLPRYRQRVRSVPLRLARPVWVDDPHFHLDYHVRHTALPAPGGETELRNLVGRVMGQQLDRQRPLWELWFVQGLTDDRWAMVSKVHHCMVDGIAGTDLLALTLEDHPDPTPPEPTRWVPDAQPSRLGLVRDAAGDLVKVPGRVVRGAPELVRHPGRTGLQAAAALKGTLGLAGLLDPMPATSLNGPIGPHRRWAPVRAGLGEVKAVRRALGGTVNDVALAAVTSGYRALLDHRGELDPEVTVRTMVPVSLRTSAERGQTDNRVAAVFVDLPVAEPDPVRRLELISAATKDAKASGEQVATAALIGLTGVTPAMFVGLALRSVTGLVQRAGQRFVSTVTTNVPGPQEPWYLLGRRLLAAYPYVPIGAGLRTGIAIFSYDGRLTFGVTADYDTTPDVDVLAGGLKRGLVELAEAAGLDPADAISPAGPAPQAGAPAAGNRARASRRGSAAG